MAGRKKINDRCKPVTVYVKESIINNLGGIDATRDKVLNILNADSHE